LRSNYMSQRGSQMVHRQKNQVLLVEHFSFSVENTDSRCYASWKNCDFENQRVYVLLS
jgi:hypothetical protein